MGPIITIPATGVADLVAYVGQLATDLWPLIAIGIGVPLSFYIISRAMGLVRSRTRK